jgi:hypothetical protein
MLSRENFRLFLILMISYSCSSGHFLVFQTRHCGSSRCHFHRSAMSSMALPQSVIMRQLDQPGLAGMPTKIGAGPAWLRGRERTTNVIASLLWRNELYSSRCYICLWKS